MPSPETAFLVDTAVLWPAVGFDDNGDPIVGSPIEIPCRWTEGMTESVSPKGEPIGLSDLVMVDQVIPIGSLLWLGTLLEWQVLPTDPDLRSYVKERKRVPDIKGRSVFYSVGLMRYKDVNI